MLPCMMWWLGLLGEVEEFDGFWKVATPKLVTFFPTELRRNFFSTFCRIDCFIIRDGTAVKLYWLCGDLKEFFHV